MAELHLQFTIEEAGERLDKLLVKKLPTATRTQIQIMIKDGFVTVDGASVKPGIKLKAGSVVNVSVPETATEETIGPVTPVEPITLDIIYEDDDLAVINKPADMVVHPSIGHEAGTLSDIIKVQWPQIAEINDEDGRKGIVHRLDKDTSGLIVIAKNESALENLMQQFQERTVEKQYLALLERTPATHNGRIEAPIGRDPKQRKKMAVIPDGKEAITEFFVIDDSFRDDAALVEFKLLTGRTHQIRVHAAFIGCPIVGDRAYGFRKQRTKMKRNFLHAAKIAFDHPSTGERMEFECELPIALKQIMEKLR